MKKPLIIGGAVISIGALTALLYTSNTFSQVPQTTYEGIDYNVRIHENSMEIYKEEGWSAVPVKGVNIGMAKPGTFPGEAGISREEYRRWFEQIGEMNANTIRNYTLHPPEFYEELLAYNQQADEPIYLFHGVWIEERPLEETMDAFDEDITEEFQEEMKRIVDVIHGSAEVEERAGHAHGEYTADISSYVAGWMLGIEWHPEMVDNMLQKYPDLGDYDGNYFTTENAAPMEYWLAEQFDVLFDYEKDNYQVMRPFSFTNWVTTDNLDQPSEPSEDEDLAEINPNHIVPNGEASEVGTFAVYHVYPYYPEFLNLEEEYLTFEDHLGNPSNYAGYLHDLHQAHDIPVMIGEFGIPSSRGKTHNNPFGWNQGFISEAEQGEIVSYLYDVIMEEGMLGGLVFTWQDEWFKRTWNTMDYDNPDRRPFWSNAQTNEQHFGLLSFDRHKVRINGEDDWEGGSVVAEQEGEVLQSVTADHDERYLYVKAEGEFEAGDELNLYFSIRSENGIEAGGMKSDFRLSLNEDKGRMMIAGDYDTFFHDYGEDITEETYSDMEKKKIMTSFQPLRLALNKEIIRPDTGETIPFEYYETGEFLHGQADPEEEEYNSLHDYMFSAENNYVEIRIPWMLLNAKDPSQREFIGDLQNEGLSGSIFIDNIAVSAVLRRSEDKTSTLPVGNYTWEKWEEPMYEERLKRSYYDIQDVFSKYTSHPAEAE
jgi:hypothetical protein